MNLVVRGARILLPGGMRPGAIHIRDGQIVEIAEHRSRPAGVPELDAGELVVLPGMVDTHVHINDPGRSDWEGFEHATRAAAAGGVTTLVDMPLNSLPSTTTVEGLKAKLRAASGRCHVDVGFWGGVVPGNTAALSPLVGHGVLGFKCFLSPSGVEEFDHVAEHDLREAMPVLAKLGVPLLAHAELPARLRGPDPGRDPRDYWTWLDSRPPESELEAIEVLIRLASETGAAVHIVHLASADALGVIVEARSRGVPITVETCPHYLTFAAEDIPAGATPFKCAPPIRQRGHRERLWAALADGRLDLIATDHSPAIPELKMVEEGDFVRAWGGIASLQIALPAIWTGAAVHGLALDRVAGWLAAAPARLAGLGNKGAIAAGNDADLVVFDPDAEVVVDARQLHHRHPITPYAGMRLRGRVETTLLRGAVIYDRAELTERPSGRQILGRKPGARIAG
jgi:allantoinase